MKNSNREHGRRDFLIAGGGVIGAMALAPSAGATDHEGNSALKSKLLCVVDAQLESPQLVGATPHGNRRIVYVTGGTVTGERVGGKLLAGGGDWLRVRPDGIMEIDVRATIETDDGVLIFTHYRGVINPKTGYFRTTPRFETASEKYGWLNNVVAVGVGQGTPTGVKYNIFEIL